MMGVEKDKGEIASDHLHMRFFKCHKKKKVKEGRNEAKNQ